MCACDVKLAPVVGGNLFHSGTWGRLRRRGGILGFTVSFYDYNDLIDEKVRLAINEK
jgi:hypothetical protein